MALLSLQSITHAFGRAPVLDEVKLTVNRGDRLALLGRNGEGKSTLFNILAGQIIADSGAVHLERHATIGFLDQELPQSTPGSVYQIVTSGLGGAAAAVGAYHDAALALAISPDDTINMTALERAQTALEAAGGWDIHHRVETIMTKLGLDGGSPFAQLSGGWRRRVLLGQTLASEPDVLLLDEPTNHLDINAIIWLESFLQQFSGALFFVTHDRAFLKNVATRIVELDRGRLEEFPNTFDGYLEAKAQRLEVEAQQNAVFDKKLADEEAWLRTGIKARRTRNEGRVRALLKLRDRSRERRKRKGQATIAVQQSKRSGQRVIEATDVHFAYENAAKASNADASNLEANSPKADNDKPLIDGLSLTLKRGQRLGLIGPNGVGKTTLLKLLLGQLQPSAGTVEHGTRLEIAYYDQLRNHLTNDQTVAQTILEKGDMVEIDGRQRHIVGYLRDFLFDADQVHSPVSTLSGGERNRLLLAKLLSLPANVLVLDEPTNDLDIETLEILEERLINFPGTVLLVSHDRAFLDRVVTTSLIFEGGGRITQVAGGYDQWARRLDERKQREDQARRAEANRRDAELRDAKAQKKAAAPRKLSYAQRQELEALPQKLEDLEALKSTLHDQVGTEAVYSDPAALTRVSDELTAVEARLEDAYSRWEELEALSER